MTPTYFESPVAAVLAGFPRGAVRIVGVRAEDDDAYVLIDARPDGPTYLYGIVCKREADGWTEGSSSNGAGYTATDLALDVGVVVHWDEVPAEVDRVRVALGTDVHDELVENGAYLSAWFCVPSSEDDWPRVVALHIAGEWVESAP